MSRMQVLFFLFFVFISCISNAQINPAFLTSSHEFYYDHIKYAGNRLFAFRSHQHNGYMGRNRKGIIPAV
jgi:hypothetical protein